MTLVGKENRLLSKEGIYECYKGNKKQLSIYYRQIFKSYRDQPMDSLSKLKNSFHDTNIGRKLNKF